jgi:hypothetical protein
MHLVAQVASGAAAPAMITHASCVDSTSRWLGMLIGKYRVQALTRTGSGAWDSTAAQARFGWELGGCLMVERFEGRRDGEPYQTMALWGTSGSHDHPIQRAFAHSQHGLLGLSEGRWDAAGDTLVLADSAFVRGRWVQERYVVSRPRGGLFTAEGRRSEDGGKAWIITLRARYVRIGSG